MPYVSEAYKITSRKQENFIVTFAAENRFSASYGPTIWKGSNCEKFHFMDISFGATPMNGNQVVAGQPGL